MSDDEVYVDPAAARKKAGDLESSASTLSQAWTTFCLDLASLNGVVPWGTDESGTKFNEEYLDGDKPVTQLVNGTGEMMVLLDKLGPDIKSCVDGNVDADDIVVSWFPEQST